MRLSASDLIILFLIFCGLKEYGSEAGAVEEDISTSNLVELKSVNYFLDELGDNKTIERKACLERTSRTCGYSEINPEKQLYIVSDYLTPFRCLPLFSSPVCFASQVSCCGILQQTGVNSCWEEVSCWGEDSCWEEDLFLEGCCQLCCLLPFGSFVDLINFPSQSCGYCLHKTCVENSVFPALKYRNAYNFQIYSNLLKKGDFEIFGLSEISEEKLSFIAEILNLNNFEINYDGKVLKVVNGYFESPVLKSMDVGEEAFKDELVQQIRVIRLKTDNFSLEHIARFTSFLKNRKGTLLSKPPSSGFVLLEWFIKNLDYLEIDVEDSDSVTNQLLVDAF